MHGINFGCRCEYCRVAQLPPAIKKRFAARVKLVGADHNEWHRLQGVAQSSEELEGMLGDVQRPGRSVHVVRRHTAGGDWYGIYVR